MKKSFCLQVFNLTRCTFYKSIKLRTQTENLANKSHKQFYGILNTNQIKLYTYSDLLKENPLLRNNDFHCNSH